MTFDRDQFDKATDARKNGRTREIMPLLRAVEAAAPVMQKMMTESDNWNRYLTYLQGFIEKARQRKAMTFAQIDNPSILDDKDLRRLKNDLVIAQSMIDAWTLAVELPKAIIDNGAEAQAIIDKFEREHEKPTV